MNPPSFDLATAHRWFSGRCFNRTWELLEKADRTPGEDEELLAVALASLWHWKQRADVTPRNLSVGYWQISRVFAVLGQAENAKAFGEKCLVAGEGDEPFYLGFAHEALARAAKLAGDTSAYSQHLQQAQTLATQVADADERGMLQKDLEGLAP